MARQEGFTLIEAVIAMVITGIIAAMVSVFIAKPVEGYVDTVRRAELTDMADLALKRMALELRTAVPNSIPKSALVTTEIEFFPAYYGGRYCSDTDTCPTANGDLDFGAGDAGGNTFDILGPGPGSISAGSYLIVYNTGQCSVTACNAATPCLGLNAYEGCNRRSVTTVSATPVTALTFDGAEPVLQVASPSKRFQLVSATGPVKFKCVNNELRRYTGYGFDHNESDATDNALLVKAGNLQCKFWYTDLSATNGLLTMELTLSSQGEGITLRHQIHVDNMP